MIDNHLDYVRFLASIWLHPVDTVVLAVLKVNPVNEVTFKVVIKVKDIVAWKQEFLSYFFCYFFPREVNGYLFSSKYNVSLAEVKGHSSQWETDLRT